MTQQQHDASEALAELGTLDRNAAGVEVWTIRSVTGAVIARDVESDHDAAAIALGELVNA